ncbi:hypothetical protein [Pseudohongiella sp.]|uniref:CobQ/CobB/MinD/ParA nucleotide binding domain-containing protein n=1 Tax=marine sediment metagenome TaxID=412755 RepID=A0A0F9YH35_9ZZZZ|nr:hypothetical protein [Pseudohongiella sp.]HDZ09195.1 hypothetical protein [Pseudohongiella sp.]
MTAQLALPQHHLILAASEKGGVGKSLLSLGVCDWLSLAGNPPSVIQIDRQRRLADALGGDVLTIASDPAAARVNPEIEVQRFSPLLERIEQTHSTSPVLIDVGAGECDRFATWASLVDLEEDLLDWDIQCHILIPFLAEAESIRQAAWTAERLQKTLPSASFYLVENRRDGMLSQKNSQSSAAEAAKKYLNPWFKKSGRITLPAIPAGSWRSFESANCRFIDVVDMTTAETMALTGLPRAESKIARGDISQWLVSVFDQLDKTFTINEART